MIETVNDFENVIFEIVNEAGSYSTDWQRHIIRFVRATEAPMRHQHLVGMGFQFQGGNNQTLFDSEADWIRQMPARIRSTSPIHPRPMDQR